MFSLLLYYMWMNIQNVADHLICAYRKVYDHSVQDALVFASIFLLLIGSKLIWLNVNVTIILFFFASIILNFRFDSLVIRHYGRGQPIFIWPNFMCNFQETFPYLLNEEG